jgi:hypothetical protein
MNPSLAAGAVIAAAPAVKRVVRPVVVQSPPTLQPVVVAADGFGTPESEEGDGEDSEPPSLASDSYALCPTLVCPGLGLFLSKE